MKTTIIANGSTDKLVLVPETELEKAWVMSVNNEATQNATVKRGQYRPQDGTAEQPEAAVIVTVPHVKG